LILLKIVKWFDDFLLQSDSANNSKHLTTRPFRHDGACLTIAESQPSAVFWAGVSDEAAVIGRLTESTSRQCLL